MFRVEKSIGAGRLNKPEVAVTAGDAAILYVLFQIIGQGVTVNCCKRLASNFNLV